MAQADLAANGRAYRAKIRKALGAGVSREDVAAAGRHAGQPGIRKPGAKFNVTLDELMAGQSPDGWDPVETAKSPGQKAKDLRAREDERHRRFAEEMAERKRAEDEVLAAKVKARLELWTGLMLFQEDELNPFVRRMDELWRVASEETKTAARRLARERQPAGEKARWPIHDKPRGWSHALAEIEGIAAPTLPPEYRQELDSIQESRWNDFREALNGHADALRVHGLKMPPRRV